MLNEVKQAHDGVQKTEEELIEQEQVETDP
jgi:hypothetical protein